ncbi:putative reverse transcriptase domain-containing protein [Tanacetum coccineum]
MKSHDSSFWKEAVNDEMDSIIGNNTWILVDLPPGSKAIKIMSPSKRKFRWGIMRSTGIKRYIDPISGCKIWHANQYHTSDEEEEEPSKHPPYNKYGFVDHPQLQMEDQRNKFAPYPLPPQEGNMNGWLIDDANDSDLESTTSNQPMNLTMEDIEVANGKKEEVDRIFRGCRLELGDSIFPIDLIPLGQGSFDVIVGMDWLSNQKVVIVYHEKIVRIHVEEGKVLCVQGERNVGKTKTLISTKENEPTLSDIPIVCDFEDVFLDDLSGLPPQ